MGREIRRVPKGWEHPKDDKGNYIPMHDRTYDEAADEWLKGLLTWVNDDKDTAWDGEIREKPKGYKYYWDYHGDPPSELYYRPMFSEPPTCYQMYETVSEGTPVSPVFETKEELREWLIGQGHSRIAAQRFVDAEWAPSMIISGGISATNVDAFDIVQPNSKE